ncbi:hypothetical protein ACAW74_08475 [Fibrella sp. WM1]|uniref:hypothetical protein n=1 Tax=Fibrella musci TaxID=3242485 RepID=UPI0035204DEA
MTPEESYYNDLLTQFGQLTTATMILPVAVVMLKYRQFNQPIWAFWWFAVATLFCSGLEVAFIWAVNAYKAFWSPYLSYWGIGDTHFLQIISYLCNFGLFGWCYSLLFVGKLRQYIRWTALGLSVFALVDYVWLTGYKSPGVLIPIMNGLFTTLLPMFYLWFLGKSGQQVSFFQVPYVWFSLGFILLHLTTLLFYFVGAKLYETDFVLFVKASFVRNVIMIIQNVFYAYGLWKTTYAKFINPLSAD